MRRDRPAPPTRHDVTGEDTSGGGWDPAVLAGGIVALTGVLLTMGSDLLLFSGYRGGSGGFDLTALSGAPTDLVAGSLLGAVAVPLWLAVLVPVRVGTRHAPWALRTAAVVAWVYFAVGDTVFHAAHGFVGLAARRGTATEEVALLGLLQAVPSAAALLVTVVFAVLVAGRRTPYRWWVVLCCPAPAWVVTTLLPTRIIDVPGPAGAWYATVSATLGVAAFVVAVTLPVARRAASRRVATTEGTLVPRTR